MSSIVVEGRLVSPTRIELASPVNLPNDVVEVEIRPRVQPNREAVLALLKRMAAFPPGNRSREDIERQIREERDSWESRR